MRLWALFLCTLYMMAGSAEAASRIERFSIQSEEFEGNKAGVSGTRNVAVYLPDGYDGSAKHYPVIYYLHNFFEDETAIFDHRDLDRLLDREIAGGEIGGVIVVSADFSTPAANSVYINSLVTGNWRNFMVEELVPAIDRRFRTIATRDGRGIAGHNIGGYGAIRFASRHPETFGSVYALHPVATGFGHYLMQGRPDWARLAEAKGLEEFEQDFLTRIFISIYQAALPNPDKPPFYFDAPAHLEDGKLVLDAALVERVQQNFFLEREVPLYAENLKTLKGFKFDWGRHDQNLDHVYSNHFYTRKLNEFGVPHESEEFNGGWDDRLFTDDGRVVTDMVPFFRRHLAFE